MFHLYFAPFIRARQVSIVVCLINQGDIAYKVVYQGLLFIH